MTSVEASQAVTRLLLGESIHELRASTLWEMRFSNDIWLVAYEISCSQEKLLRAVLERHMPEMVARIDSERVPQAALLFSFMMHPLTAAVVNEAGELRLEFGDTRAFTVRSDTEIVDWQWCISRTCSDPYSAPSEVSCTAFGRIEL
jgi:Family of unknown function (DUF6188)